VKGDQRTTHCPHYKQTVSNIFHTDFRMYIYTHVRLTDRCSLCKRLGSCQTVVIVWIGDCLATSEGSQMTTWMPSLCSLCFSNNFRISHWVHIGSPLKCRIQEFAKNNNKLNCHDYNTVSCKCPFIDRHVRMLLLVTVAFHPARLDVHTYTIISLRHNMYGLLSHCNYMHIHSSFVKIDQELKQ
jgi:hypothetical protein